MLFYCAHLPFPLTSLPATFPLLTPNCCIFTLTSFFHTTIIDLLIYFLYSRFSIDPQSDPEALFRITPDTGLITTAMELDREREHWHNITVIATQRGQRSLSPDISGLSVGLWRARKKKTHQTFNDHKGIRGLRMRRPLVPCAVRQPLRSAKQLSAQYVKPGV